MKTITFYGAAGGVTGSKHLLDTGSARILLDCGTFQGLPDVRERNRGFPFPPESIDHVVLSHAHIDHSGMLPLLVKRGFTGNIFATEATKDVVQHMLEDSAGIEVQDAAYRKKHHVGAPDEREPLFTPDDIPPVIDRFISVPYARFAKPGQEWTPVASGIKLKMYDAGHILGSAISVLDVDGRRIAYSGDLGPNNIPIHPNPSIPQDEKIELLLLESTYGSRTHEGLEPALGRLAKSISEVVKRKGKIIVPAFSLGRTQIIVYVIHKLTDEGRIPRFPIYVDSPLATDITSIYQKHINLYDKEAMQDFGSEPSGPLAFRNLTYTRSPDESKQLNSKEGPFMVISASGMMTAGRVVHHLRHSISNPNNAVFITGYQAEGTLGRRLLEGAKRVELYGDWFDVQADIQVFNEFSAHADQNELQQFAEGLHGLNKIALVHGEARQADDLKAHLELAHPEWEVTRPAEGDSISL